MVPLLTSLLKKKKKGVVDLFFFFIDTLGGVTRATGSHI